MHYYYLTGTVHASVITANLIEFDRQHDIYPSTSTVSSNQL